MRRVLIGLVGLVVVGGLGYGAFFLISDPRRSAPVATSTVVLTDNAFDNPVITVPAGTEVTWRWEGEEIHNVSGDGWVSPDMIESEWSQTFDEPGTYDYVCSLHALRMRGRVIVEG